MNQVTITELVKLAGENSRDHGFHDDWPKEVWGNEPSQRQVSLAITEKLALIHEEISEALGEIRDGHAPSHVYYSNKATLTVEPHFLDPLTEVKHRTWAEQQWEPVDDAFPNGPYKPVLKPEGFGIELADAMIRIADLTYLTGIDLEALLLEKAEYNTTRPFKHGRKF